MHLLAYLFLSSASLLTISFFFTIILRIICALSYLLLVCLLFCHLKYSITNQCNTSQPMLLSAFILSKTSVSMIFFPTTLLHLSPYPCLKSFSSTAICLTFCPPQLHSKQGFLLASGRIKEKSSRGDETKVSPSPMGGWVWGGAVPPPQKFF